MEDKRSPNALSDDELLRRVVEITNGSRQGEAALLAHLAEFDARRLYARQACASMFAYCTDVLHFSEAEAYLRIAAARASRQHPILLAMLADGRLHLSSIARLAPHLDPANATVILARAVHRSKRQIEELIAELAPRPDVAALVRRLPQPAAPAGQGRLAGSDNTKAPADNAPRQTQAAAELVPERVDGPAPARAALQGQVKPSAYAVANRASVEATAPGRFKVQFTASRELRDKLERLQELLRGSAAGDDLAAVIEQAVTEKLERLEARRFGQVRRQRGERPEGEGSSESAPPSRRHCSSRHIPAALRRAVYERDGGRCCYTDGKGRRRGSRRGLEYHHRRPYGHGGEHTLENVCLLCSVHHRLMGEADFGEAARLSRPQQGREMDGGRKDNDVVGGDRMRARYSPGATVPCGTVLVVSAAVDAPPASG
jgi:hypothetical protein